MKKRASLKDIAQKTGLSVPTVSQILNGRPGNFSSEATRKLVTDAAAELGYKPNFGYKVMLGHKTKTVALVISEQRVKEEEHIQSLIIRLMDELNARGFATYISTLGMVTAENLETISGLIARGAEHFIFIGSPVGYLEIGELLKSLGKTCVGYNSIFDRNVEADTCFGMESVIRYFTDHGKERIKLVMELQGSRLEALKNVFPGVPEQELMSKYVIFTPIPDFIPWSFNEACFKSGYDATVKVLEKEKNIDGLIYLSDYFALGGCKCLIENGLRPGADILVAGYNYTRAVRYSQLPILSVEHDIKTTSIRLADNVAGESPVNELIKPFLREGQL